MLRITLGFLLLIALSYATVRLEETMKQESQKQILISVSEYTADRIFSTIQDLGINESASQEYRLPLSRDAYSGQYQVWLEDIDGVAYVKAQSARWPDMIARQPLFLDTSHLEMGEYPANPPGLCVSASRNNTHHTITIHC